MEHQRCLINASSRTTRAAMAVLHLSNASRHLMLVARITAVIAVSVACSSRAVCGQAWSSVVSEHDVSLRAPNRARDGSKTPVAERPASSHTAVHRRAIVSHLLPRSRPSSSSCSCLPLITAATGTRYSVRLRLPCPVRPGCRGGADQRLVQ